MIDMELLPEHRAMPMEVLALGLCRTGTMSMKIALEELGYSNVYHFFRVPHHSSHPALWIGALEAKHERTGGNPEKLPIANWDELLGDYSAVTDIPCVCFAEELLAAYPSAKIILTTRSPKSWQKSMLRTIHAVQSSYLNRFMLLFADTDGKSLSRLLDLIIQYYFHGDIPKFGMEVFEKHNEMVREVALKERREFLEFKLGDSWEPLCRFLDKPVPDTDFPRVNSSEAFREAFIRGSCGMTMIISSLLALVALLIAWIVSNRRLIE